MKLHKRTPRTNKVLAAQSNFSYSTLNAKGEECFTLNLWGSLEKQEEYKLELSREEMKRLYTILGAQLSNDEKGA